MNTKPTTETVPLDTVTRIFRELRRSYDDCDRERREWIALTGRFHRLLQKAAFQDSDAPLEYQTLLTDARRLAANPIHLTPPPTLPEAIA
jgi:hypothetical protein